MEKFRIEAGNLSSLKMQKWEMEPSLSLKPVVMEISDVKDLTDGFYRAEIKVTVTKFIEDSNATLYVEMQFSPLVCITCGENKETIMRESVPKRLFDNVRVIVWNLSSEANMPLMLEDDAWEVREGCVDSKKLEQESEQLDLMSAKQKEAFRDIVEAFKDLPSYDYYYRFFSPIEYTHPDFEECDEETWTVLFQLLFGSLRIDCHLDEQSDGSLDIRFCDTDGSGNTTSELTLLELEILIVDLWTEMGKGVLQIMEPENLNQEVKYELEEGALVSKKDFLSLYNVDENSNLSAMLEKMYERIVKCDGESFPYRC
jgi:hypothetical protein